MTTVRARLTVFTILVVAASLGLLGLFLRYRVEANLMGEVDRGLRDEVAAVRAGPSKEDLPGPGPKERMVLTHSLAAPDGATGLHEWIRAGQKRMMQVVESDGNEVRLTSEWSPPRLIPVGSENEPKLPVDDPAGLRQTRGQPNFHDFVRGTEPMRSLTIPVRQGGKIVAYAQAIRSLAPVREGVRDLDRALLASIPVALGLAAMGGFATVGRAMRPLRRMIGAAERLDRSGARLPIEGRDEFAELAGALNAAFERQARALAQLERFTGDAGHELRTPLASIKTSSSYLLHMADAPAELCPSLKTIDVSADRMARLIDDLLLLARQDGGGSVRRREPTDVGELIRGAVEGVEERPGVEIKVGSLPEGNLSVDADAVERVLLNLLINARDYACRRVLVTSTVVEGFLSIEVRDDGDGIAPDDLARLGERFFRPDESRSRQRGGVGLGVAIARSLCESHGGELVYESPMGEGTVASARFRVG